MSDRELIERLRSPYVEFGEDGPLAADRLEALSAEVDMYREALRMMRMNAQTGITTYREETHKNRAPTWRAAGSMERSLRSILGLSGQALKGANNG